MPDYSKEEWSRLIAHYQREFSTQYATAQQRSELPDSVTPLPVLDKPTEETPASEPPPDDIGSLQVRVSTLNNAVPLSDAVVIVTRVNANGTEDPVRVMKTDSSGTTETIDLPTKNRSLSLTPGNPAPYTAYVIDVSADGYYRKRFENVPIYAGTTAIQNAVMLPLPEGGDNDITLSYSQGGPINL